ncbi:hypothetical protein B296_00034472 [Ensete ventricosum]|uniref:Uncharacterized protein n=1 Tax=Ensete ventricosum TaxID=4639 RepID=A0A427A8J2_ENSVE|nr:hypothetical protein B296_00034472 [Ensete ventricosum]
MICRWTFALVIVYFAITGCMHSLNAVFLLLDTFLNNLEPNLNLSAAISMVSNGIFCFLELYLCDIPMDPSCSWFYLVRIL